MKKEGNPKPPTCESGTWGTREGEAQVYFCAVEVSSVSTSDFCQLALGLYSFIALAIFPVFFPRSFW